MIIILCSDIIHVRARNVKIMKNNWNRNRCKHTEDNEEAKIEDYGGSTRSKPLMKGMMKHNDAHYSRLVLLLRTSHRKAHVLNKFAPASTVSVRLSTPNRLASINGKSPSDCQKITIRLSRTKGRTVS